MKTFLSIVSGVSIGWFLCNYVPFFPIVLVCGYAIYGLICTIK